MSIVLSFDQIYDGYTKSIENGKRLCEAGMLINKEYPDVALGLFELGQEEIGKSYMLLSSFQYKNNSVEWLSFWKDWKDHTRKAYAAHFYEWLNPVRIEINDPKWHEACGFGIRNKIPKEKEFSFYVNYDKSKNVFVIPKDEINLEESSHRGLTLTYLYLTAQYTKHALDIGDIKFNYSMFTEIPVILLRQFILQESIPIIYEEFKKRSNEHELIVANLLEAYKQERLALEDIFVKK